MPGHGGADAVAAVAPATEVTAPVVRPRRGGTLRRLRGLLRHPRYALAVLGTLLLRPRLALTSLRRGWRAALLAECAALSPVVAGQISTYEAGFFGQVFIFDEYEVGRLHLPPAPRVCDVGANVGFFSWRVASMRPQATVLAFEPASDNVRRLRRTFAALGIAGEVCAQACGSGVGQAVLYLRNSVTHSLDPDWHTDMDGGAGSEAVEVTTLDAECDRRGWTALDLLKIDVEGAEVEVLRGARAILPATRHVVLEFHSAAAQAECRGILEGAGFRCRRKSFWGQQAAGEGLLLCSRSDAGSRDFQVPERSRSRL